ncbi:MAG: hypothetical protein MUF31_12715 [Akkermansiaceae bacterium]|jgi:hypothetical protein|nr:hypothetical protein [Akkermansiaceae bacterium]
MSPTPSGRAAACLFALLIFSACDRQEPAENTATEKTQNPEAQPKTAQREGRPDPGTRLRKARDEALAETDPAKRERLLAQVIWDAFETDPDFAQECFDLLEPGSPSTLRLLSHVGLRLAEQDPAAALEWARGIDREIEKNVALGAVALVISNQDPNTAATIALDEMAAGLERNRCAVQITQRWAQQDPAAAATWIAAFPHDTARETGMRTVIDSWLRHDPAAMTRWILATNDPNPWQTHLLAALESEPDPAKRETLRETIQTHGLPLKP